MVGPTASERGLGGVTPSNHPPLTVVYWQGRRTDGRTKIMPDRALILAALALLLAAAQTLAGPLVARPSATPLKEMFHQEAPVSGRIVSGVLVAGEQDKTHRLVIWPPASVAGRSVCLQVVSRDGRYWAENTFELPPRTGGRPVVLKYPSAYRDLLQTLGDEELAMLAYPGRCGAGGPRQLLLAARTLPEAAPRRLEILVNSGRTDTYAVVKDAAGARPSRCRRIRQGRRTAFDTVCRIALTPSAVEDPSVIQVRILRRRYERMLPPTELVIALPDRVAE